MTLYSDYAKKSNRPYSASSLPDVIAFQATRKRGVSFSNYPSESKDTQIELWKPSSLSARYGKLSPSPAMKYRRFASSLAKPAPNYDAEPLEDVNCYESYAPLRSPAPIYILGEGSPYSGLTNFSPHPVKYQGKIYTTSEHHFQCLKFISTRPRLAEHIRLYCPTPINALTEGRRFQPEVREDWLEVQVEMMDLVLLNKFSQHPTLRAELLNTGDSELYEVSSLDLFWGLGPRKNGHNEMGKALMRLRSKLRLPR